MDKGIEGIRFQCLRCGRCCGPHYVSEREQAEIDRYLAERDMPKRAFESIYDKCPYYEDNSCLIYPVRPLVCRLMGLTELMPCPSGVVPDRKISKEEAVRMLEDAQSSKMEV